MRPKRQSSRIDVAEPPAHQSCSIARARYRMRACTKQPFGELSLTSSSASPPDPTRIAAPVHAKIFFARPISRASDGGRGSCSVLGGAARSTCTTRLILTAMAFRVGWMTAEGYLRRVRNVNVREPKYPILPDMTVEEVERVNWRRCTRRVSPSVIMSRPARSWSRIARSVASS